ILVAMACVLVGLVLLDFCGNFIVTLLLVGLSFGIMFFAKKKITPAGQGKEVQQAFNGIKNDFTSDRAVNALFEHMGRAANFADKTMITLYLGEVYLFRGQINDAISLYNSIERSRFMEYPTVGMSFYNDIIGLYSALEDTNSVLAAYSDAEVFVNECAFRNYACCQSALELLIDVEKARGNFGKALDMQLMKNDFANRFNNQTQAAAGTYPLKQFLDGLVFYKTAELFYLCGDYSAAGQALYLGGPMLGASPFYLEKANKLSAEIKEAMSGKKAV
ncbi:MAG: hypothetical protein NC078_12800, partial [Ruminococcus sp.]|nr:hypothetical protein [Ruminococcus sp.]